MSIRAYRRLNLHSATDTHPSNVIIVAVSPIALFSSHVCSDAQYQRNASVYTAIYLQWWAVINYFLVNYVIKLLWSSWLEKFDYSKVIGNWVVVKLLFKVVNYQVVELLKSSWSLWRSFCLPSWFLSVYLFNFYYNCFAQVR